MQRNTLRISSLAFSALLLVSLTGCFHKHTFADATCTAPKICTVCGETEGEPLGHTCEIGTCKQCGEFQHEERWDSINRYIEKSDNSINVFLSKISNAHDVYTSIINSYDLIEDAENKLRSARMLCANYSELRDLKSALDDALESAPKDPPINSYSSLASFLTQLESFVTYVAYAQIETTYIS